MRAAPIPYYAYNAGRPGHNLHSNAFSTQSTSPPVTSDADDLNNINMAGEISPKSSPQNLTDLLEPAVDGPPSPERIRQLNNQMRRATHLNKSYGHRAASSSASSFLASERAGWEQAMDNTTLSRRSSNRSATSSSHSRERDSVQVLGKNIFHRRAKSSKSGRPKRESSAHSSSGSSLYSADFPSETSLSNLKDSFMPTIFARRKTSRDETATQRRLQISGPFNFQHVTHTPRDQVTSLQRGNRRELMEELSTLRMTSPASAPGGIRGPENQDMFISNFPPEQLNYEDTSNSQPLYGLRQNATALGARRLVTHVRSQEQLRTSPPRPARPPRSPVEQLGSPTLPPVPPPRVSSRQSLRGNGSPAGDFDRPLTSGGFCRPRPFSPDEYQGDSFILSDESLPEPELEPIDEARFSHALTTPDDAAWPLTSGVVAYESPLPDVPEEEEHFVYTHRSRVSVVSNSSSLRASQSVPALRTLSQSYRMSGASETLGPLETATSPRTARGGQQDGHGAHVSPIRENWEDAIDYCYDHEADANFEYEWERPSLDVGSEKTTATVQVAVVEDALSEAPTVSSTTHSSPGMLSASRFDVPALSPASQASPVVGHEIATPVSTTAKNNFSFPRGERLNRPSNLMPTHARCDSRASSFKESHGFTLSPSLLIPSDYHHQMMLSETDRNEYPNEDEFHNKFFKSDSFYDDNLTAANQASLMQQQRASVSTTATNSTTLSTTISDSTGERHVSGNSTWTTLTRFTSSTSLNKMAGSWSDETGDRVPSTHLVDPLDDSDQEETTPPASKDKDTVPELAQFPTAPVGGMRPFHKSHVSESSVRDEVPAMKSPEPTKPRRPRARTTSLSQAPPVGQYALFPRTYVKTTGDRI